MRSSTLVLLLVCGAVPVHEAAAASNYCTRVCAVPKGAPGAHLVTIDAGTGQASGGSLRIQNNAQVQVLLQNKNPFKYTYRTHTSTQPLTPAIALDFLGRIPGLDLRIAKTAPDSSLVAAAAAAKSDACTGNDAKWSQDIITTVGKLGGDSQKLAGHLGYVDRLSEFLVQTGADTLSNCADICTRAEELQRTPHEPNVILQEVTDFSAAVTALEGRLTSPAGVGTGCVDAIKDKTAPERSALKTDATQYTAGAPTLVNALRQNAAQIKTVDNLLNALLATDTLFHESRFFPTGAEASAVRIEVFRRNLRAEGLPEQTLASVGLEAGRSPFSISAGILISTLGNRRVIRQPARVPVEGNPDQIGLIFGYAEDSPFTLAPHVALNARITPPKWPVGFGGSLGVLALSDGPLPRVEYTLGAFFSFADESLFLGLGAHFAQRETLAGGFKPDEVVPADLPDPLPTQNSWAAGFVTSLTFRIR